MSAREKGGREREDESENDRKPCEAPNPAHARANEKLASLISGLTCAAGFSPRTPSVILALESPIEAVEKLARRD